MTPAAKLEYLQQLVDSGMINMKDEAGMQLQDQLIFGEAFAHERKLERQWIRQLKQTKLYKAVFKLLDDNEYNYTQRCRPDEFIPMDINNPLVRLVINDSK
jgi:hypothetical protein